MIGAALFMVLLQTVIIPKWIRARQGINVGFVYKELPPE